MKTVRKMAVLFALFRATFELWAQPPQIDSTHVLRQDGRITNLELMRDNLSRELYLHKVELSQQVIALENQSLILFSITSIIAGIGTLSILVSFWKGIQKAKEKFQLQAEDLIEKEIKEKLPKIVPNLVIGEVTKQLPSVVQPILEKDVEKNLPALSLKLIVEEVDRKVPAITEELVKEEIKIKLPEVTKLLLKPIIESELEPLFKVVEDQRQKEKVKQQARVVLWAESEERAEAGLLDFAKAGFINVEIGKPDDSALPDCDMIVFVRTDPQPDAGWKVMKDGFIKHILDKFGRSEKHLFFYYGPNNPALNTKMAYRLAFANYQSTILDRAFPILSKLLSNEPAPSNLG
jgi:hypothetical protein